MVFPHKFAKFHAGFKANFDLFDKLQNGTLPITHWPLRDLRTVRSITFEQILVIKGQDISCEIALRWMSLNLSMISRHWVRWWLGAARHQAITSANADPVYCIASLGHELTLSTIICMQRVPSMSLPSCCKIMLVMVNFDRSDVK